MNTCLLDRTYDGRTFRAKVPLTVDGEGILRVPSCAMRLVESLVAEELASGPVGGAETLLLFQRVLRLDEWEMAALWQDMTTRKWSEAQGDYDAWATGREPLPIPLWLSLTSKVRARSSVDAADSDEARLYFPEWPKHNLNVTEITR